MLKKKNGGTIGKKQTKFNKNLKKKNNNKLLMLNTNKNIERCELINKKNWLFCTFVTSICEISYCNI